LTAQIMASEFHTADDLNWMTPHPGRVVQVVDEDGAKLPPGVDGLLRIQLDELDSRAYLDDPEATARVFRGGFFYPGDLAVAREDGRVRILGRAADVINIRGQKLAVAPMEEKLQQGLGVDEVALFSGLGADGVEELVVAVRSTTPIERAEVERRLGGSAIFDKVRVEVFADFPRTENGKTRRLELRRMLFADGPR
jgi:acyl-coenzyme A synthetase/AMP-(fatty) acid ligase